MDKEPLDLGPATLFNTHMADWGARVNTFVNHLLLISGGILSITIGAFLNGSPPKLQQDALFAVQNGWYLLSSSLVLSLMVALLHVIAQAIVIARWKKKFIDGPLQVQIIQGAGWFRVLIWGVLVAAFLCCVAGIIFISYGAAQLLHVQP